MKQKSKPSQTKPRSALPRAVAILFALALVAGLGYWAWQRQHPSGSISSGTAVAFQKLTGRWLRPDGGYILEIKSVNDTTGQMDAGYFNPNPINVSKAEASRENATVKVFVELRAPNYPGSTYTLTYDPATDHLTGMYFKAALKQQFDVVFERTQ